MGSSAGNPGEHAGDVRPMIAFYGDDFTGSTDALAQYHRLGLDGALLVTPSDEVLARLADTDTAVIGVAGVSRSLAGDELRDEVTAALRWLRGLGARLVQYKLCSTFDSSRTIGNLAEVVQLGQEIFGRAPVPVMPAQPEFGRFTVFGHHFAREAGAVYRLDRHPTMSRHPSTPMRESDLRIELSDQGDVDVAGFSLEDLRAAPSAVTERFLRLPPTTFDAVVFDAVTNDDVVAVGRLLWEQSQTTPIFAMGSGGMSFGVAQHLAAEGIARGDRSEPAVEPADRVLAVSGSLAPQTRRQVEQAVSRGWIRIPLGLHQLLSPETAVRERHRALEELVAGFSRARGVVLDTLAAVEASQAPGGDTARILGGELAYIVNGALEQLELPRVLICGGDTSGHTVRSLGVDALTVQARLGVAVTMCRAWSTDNPLVDQVDLILKGGQAGADDLFERTLHGDRPQR